MTETEHDWTETVQRVGPDLYRFFLVSFPAHLASDLVQETLIRLVQKHRNGDFDSSKGAIKSYAFGIARYVRLEALKKKVDFDLVENDSQLEVSSADHSNHTDQVAHLRWAIGQLQ